MTWTGDEFKFRHNPRLTDSEAEKAAQIANGLIEAGEEPQAAVVIANRRVMKERVGRKTVKPKYFSTGKSPY